MIEVNNNLNKVTDTDKINEALELLENKDSNEKKIRIPLNLKIFIPIAIIFVLMVFGIGKYLKSDSHMMAKAKSEGAKGNYEQALSIVEGIDYYDKDSIDKYIDIKLGWGEENEELPEIEEHDVELILRISYYNVMNEFVKIQKNNSEYNYDFYPNDTSTNMFNNIKDASYIYRGIFDNYADHYTDAEIKNLDTIYEACSAFNTNNEDIAAISTGYSDVYYFYVSIANIDQKIGFSPYDEYKKSLEDGEYTEGIETFEEIYGKYCEIDNDMQQKIDNVKSDISQYNQKMKELYKKHKKSSSVHYKEENELSAECNFNMNMSEVIEYFENAKEELMNTFWKTYVTDVKFA